MVADMAQARGIVFCGGGTGGHIFPGLAVAAACREAGVDRLVWIGDPQRIEAEIVPAAGLELLPFGLSRPRLLNPLWHFKALRLLWKTWRYLRAHPPKCIVASGGYAALLPGLLAPLLGRPLIVIEPNARPGKTNRLLACFADLVITQFADARKFLQAERVEQFGNPVRPINASTRGQSNILKILVMGGSLSASGINKLLQEALPHVDKQAAIEFIHLAGKANVEETERFYEEAGMSATVHGFVDDMPALYNEIDLAICRSGATSVSELCAAGIGSIYIPLPWAADDHQTANARAVARVGGAVVLPQRQLSGKGLAQLITRLNNNRDEVAKLGENATQLARPDAAQDIWNAMRRMPGADHAVA